eukprot:TRINITY_DN30890_c0_g1_i1.p1 TRINITY_DN30890_c0_g1~~TRINITY_DN30890_c0_g1_i1.p1  ORF type:complete len:655 (+),score=121.64 TRINITY_DN30890_c0_g1_i1:60-2024(+)
MVGCGKLSGVLALWAAANIQNAAMYRLKESVEQSPEFKDFMKKHGLKDDMKKFVGDDAGGDSDYHHDGDYGDHQDQNAGDDDDDADDDNWENDPEYKKHLAAKQKKNGNADAGSGAQGTRRAAKKFAPLKPGTGRLLAIRASSGKTIRANSDGSDGRVLLSGTTPCPYEKGSATQAAATGFTRSSGMAVDEDAGYVFWSVWTGSSKTLWAQDITSGVDPKYPETWKDVEFGNKDEGNERWSLNASIWRGSLSGGNEFPIITDGQIMRFKPPLKRPAWADWPRPIKLQSPGTVDVDPIQKRVFWTEMPVDPPHWIASSNYNGFDMKVQVYTCDMSKGFEAGRFKVDASNGKLYWVEKHFPYYHILKANYDGTSRESVVRFTFAVMSFVVDVEDDAIYVASAGTTGSPPGIYRTGLSGRRRSTPTRGACNRNNLEDDCVYVVRIPMEKWVNPSRDGAAKVGADEVFGPYYLALDKRDNAIYWTGYTVIDRNPSKSYRTCLNSDRPPKKPEMFKADETEIYGDITVVQDGMYFKAAAVLQKTGDKKPSTLKACKPPGSGPEDPSCVDKFGICGEVAKRPRSKYSWKAANCGQAAYAKGCCASCSKKTPSPDAPDDKEPPKCDALHVVDGKWLPKDGVPIKWKEGVKGPDMPAKFKNK